jgi:hypothetical protein
VAKQYLTDSCEFVVNRTKPLVQEEVSGGLKLVKAVGRLGFCDEVNGNRRIYTRKVWEANLKEGSSLSRMFAERRAFGLIEHPADGKVTLESPISHAVVSAQLNEDGSITGEVVIADTDEGRKIQALMALGWNPTVSSRGYGSLIKNADGIDVVQEDYICEGWDLVLTPSFSNAVVRAVGESKISKSTSTGVVESSSIEGAKPPTKINTPRYTMDANTIRQSMQSLVGQGVSSLTPQRYAEGMEQMERLHRDIEAWSAQEPAVRNWDAKRLHEELSGIQTKWTSAIEEPTMRVTRLTEEKQKILSVTEKIIHTGVALKTKLKEALDTNAKLMSIGERNLTRGRSWKKFAEGLQSKQALLSEKYDVATTALEILAKRHKSSINENNTSIVRLGRRVLQLEFAERVKTDAIFARKLKEARTPEALASLRESITNRRPAPGKQAVTKPNTTAETKPVGESKTQKPATSKQIVESKDTGNKGASIVVPVGNPRHLSESIAIARRLATASVGPSK